LTAPATAPTRRAGSGRLPLLAGAVIALAVVPLTLLGPGTDLDVGAVLRSGRAILDGDYVASRPPGAPFHEAAVGVLEAIGGTVATNLGSLVAAVVAVGAMVALLGRSGAPRRGLVAAVVVANPWFVIAATSTVDFCWALAFLVLAAVAVRDGRPVVGGTLAALAVGARGSTLALVAALVLAEALEDGGRRRAAVLAAVAAAGSALIYLPSLVAAEGSLAFAQNDVPTSTFFVQAGRFAAKDLYFFGPFAAVVLLLAVPSAVAALRRWRTDWLVRFSAAGLVASQLLFLRFPWKMGHLLPTLVCLALLLGVALRDRPQLLVALVAAQLVYAAVNVQLIRPDTPNAATGGRLTFDPGWGALVVDTRCRADDPDAWKAGRRDRLDAVWNCAKPWAD
jgi:hypothetical protein